MQTNPILAELVVREITGERMSIAEEQQVKAWLNGQPARARMLACLRDAQWRMQEWQRYKDVDKQAVWTQMQARAATLPGHPPLPALQHPGWTRDPGASNKCKLPNARLIHIWALILALLQYRF